MEDVDCPYQAGRTLQLFDTERQEDVVAKIISVFLPFTWSAVMKVVIQQESGNEDFAVLKLYDRRYCPGLREDFRITLWNADRDHEYLEFIRNGGASDFINWLETTTEKEVDDSDWDVAKNEVWVQSKCRDMWKNETTIYSALADVQGLCVPRMYKKVTVASSGLPAVTIEAFKIPGILLEFIDGFTLDTLHLETPQCQWQNLCDQAVKVVHWISDHNVLNEDVRRGNMLVRKKGGKPIKSKRVEDASDPVLVDGYDIFAIDFGLSRLRRHDETDDEWREAKYEEHEDEKIGFGMRSMLKNSCGFELNFTGTRRYDGPWMFERFGPTLTYEKDVLRQMNDDSVELKTYVRKLLEDARHWPAHLRDRIFINPSRYIMHEDEHGTRTYLKESSPVVDSFRWPEGFMLGWFVSHVIILFWNRVQESP